MLMKQSTAIYVTITHLTSIALWGYVYNMRCLSHILRKKQVLRFIQIYKHLFIKSIHTSYRSQALNRGVHGGHEDLKSKVFNWYFI
jgi:hypothetical protein